MADKAINPELATRLVMLAREINPNLSEAVIPDVSPQLGKLAHGGLIGMAHPTALKDLYEVELAKEKLGKLAHGGLIGMAHPGVIEELNTPEIK